MVGCAYFFFEKVFFWNTLVSIDRCGYERQIDKRRKRGTKRQRDIDASEEEELQIMRGESAGCSGGNVEGE